MIKLLPKHLFQAGLLFKSRKGLIVSAASSFYLLITIIPLSLLLMRILGHFMGDIRSVEKAFFNLGNELFPGVAAQAFEALRSVIAGPLFASAQFTWLNLFIFLWFSLALLNSIWAGLFLLTGDRKALPFQKHLKGMFIVSLTVVMMLTLMGLPSLIRLVMHSIRNSSVMGFIAENFPLLGHALTDLLTIGPILRFLLQSTFLHVFIFVAYFAMLYKWFFSNKISYTVALLGSLVFTFSVTIGRIVFLAYFVYIRGALIKSYGDYYTSIIAIVWVFLMFCFFYYGLCFCHVCHRRQGYLERQFIIYWQKKLVFLQHSLIILKLYSKKIGAKMHSSAKEKRQIK